MFKQLFKALKAARKPSQALIAKEGVSLTGTAGSAGPSAA